MLLSARSYPSHPKLAIPNWQLRARHRILEDVGSPAAAAAPPSHLRWLRRSLDALVVLLILLGLGLGVLYWRLRAGQPDLDGKLQLDGLSAPVTIVRDQLGVPHISAQNVHDLYLAQGFAMAQDRLWQMDVLRRLGEGRLAEVFGPAALDTDRKTRELGLPHAIDAEAARLGPEEAPLLQAFAAGVNDYIARHRWRLPLEFWLLRYRPEAWRPRDSLALAANMYQVLSSNYLDKILRESFAAKLGPDLTAQLFPERSPWDVPPGAALPAPSRGRGGIPLAGVPAFDAPAQPLPPPRGGSNDWVLSGARSLNGAPILANDPHLQFQIPGLWWTVELSTPDWQAAGVAITGVPGIIIGHNRELAWGVTNTRADVQDLYRVQLDGQGNVLTPAGWRPLEHWHEPIPVRGARQPVDLDVQVAPQGPIVAHDAGGALALRWTLYAPGALQSAHVFLGLEAAKNWKQFEAALAEFPGPTQNFVYADRAGHIAYQCAGWVPVRHGFDGSMPVPGNSNAFDWSGWIPFAQLPRVADPPSGVLATANARIAPDGYPYVISTDWDAPNRTRRIYQRLGELARWNASSMSRVQQDVISEQDRDFAQAVVAAGRSRAGNGLSITTQRALAMLAGFRGAMGATSLAPTLAYFTRDEFLRRVLAAKVGDAMARQYDWDQAPVFEQWLLSTHPAPWLPPQYAAPAGGGWDALLVDSLEAVAERYTLDPAQLRWQRFETLAIDHPVFSHIPLLKRIADLGPVPINGSPLTVKQARNLELGDISNLGPSMRFVADLGDWDRSTLTLVAGESGLVFQSHYRDQWPAYLRGEALPLWFSPAAVAKHQAHHLTLGPR